MSFKKPLLRLYRVFSLPPPHALPTLDHSLASTLWPEVTWLGLALRGWEGAGWGAAPAVSCSQNLCSLTSSRALSPTAGQSLFSSWWLLGAPVSPTLHEIPLPLLLTGQFMSDLGWLVFLSLPPFLFSCLLFLLFPFPSFPFLPPSFLSPSLPCYVSGGMLESRDKKINRRVKRVPIQQRLIQ